MAEPRKIQTRVKSVMEDPSAQAVAAVYAEAFLDAAASADVKEALDEFSSFVDDVLANNPELAVILQSSIVARDEKIALIDNIVGRFGSETFANFLRVLAKHERLDLLPLIAAESRVRHEKRMGQQRVQVISATELAADVTDRIGKKLDESLPFEPLLETRTDPSLLGGIVIQIGDTVYDSSLRSRIKQLREQLRQRSLHEIQSGRDRFSHPEGN